MSKQMMLHLFKFKKVTLLFSNSPDLPPNLEEIIKLKMSMLEDSQFSQKIYNLLRPSTDRVPQKKDSKLLSIILLT